MTYTISCRNTGGRDALAVQVRDRVYQLNRNSPDPDLVLVDGSISDNGVVGNDIFWPVGTLPAGGPPAQPQFPDARSQQRRRPDV